MKTPTKSRRRPGAISPNSVPSVPPWFNLRSQPRGSGGNKTTEARRSRRESKDGIGKLVELLMRRSRRGGGLFFITGTDTGVGKTWLTCALLVEFRRRGISAAGFKPICCGDREDAQRLWKLSGGGLTLDMVNPIHLRHPVAPVAQKCPSWSTLLRKIRGALFEIRKRNIRIVLVEGAGGLLCPIARKHTMRDLAKALGGPMVIVARDRLGVLNHTLLTLEAAGRQGCIALVLTRFGKTKDSSQQSNAKVLRSRVSVSIHEVGIRG